MASNDDASSPIADISEFTFSWAPELTGSDHVNFGDIRYSAPSFDVEETTIDFFSKASEPSPQLEYRSNLTNDNIGEGFHSSEGYMEWHSVSRDLQVDTPYRPPGSPSHTFVDMSIGEPLIPTSQMSLGFGGNEISIDDYLQDGIVLPSVDEGEVSLHQSPWTYLHTIHGGLSLSDSGDPFQDSHFLVPSVTVSPCSRPSTPPVNPHFINPPSPGSLRKSLTLDSPSLCLSPSLIDIQDPPCPPRPKRTASSRVKKHADRARRRCQYCPDPRVWKPDQRLRLDDLPPELLIEIFTFACSSLPMKRTWTCSHLEVENPQFGLPRRSTLSGTFPGSNELTEQGKKSENMLEGFYQRKFNLPRHLRLLQARTIRALQLTCRKFCHILTQYPNVDNILWKEATVACWGHLPKSLAEVQGWNKTSQTCWRNVFGVFMRSDNGMFKKKNTGGVGGVESFGGRTGFKGAVLWPEEKKLREKAKKLQGQETDTPGASSVQGKGKQRQANETTPAADSKVINRRKLLLVCPQPGPDIFTVKTLPGEGGGYEIGLSLKNREMVFIDLDEYGDFSNSKRSLPHNLRQKKKGCFPPDCFEVTGDRMKLVKVEAVKTFNHNAPDIYALHDQHGTERMRRSMTWDLECVPEYANDKRASVARCEHQNGYLVFNMFASREGFIEGLDRPSEDSRIFCVMAEGNDHPGEMPYAGRISTFKSWRSSKTRVLGHNEDFNNSSCEPRTVFKWQRSFVHPHAQDYSISQGLHYMICNLKLNPTLAVILLRWNIHSKVSYHEFVDRSFQVLDLATGAIVKVLQFPNFHWDFRHHDMTVEYNVMRYYKMRRMFNAPHAGNQATRVHRDQFTLDDKGRLICGSHDYCNWMWDLNAETGVQKQGERVFTPLHNDAGNGDPFVVLDDFYWEGEIQGTGEHTGAWNTHNERAGWWVKTPNQVLSFWHNITISKDGKWFAAVRAGRMFVWNLEDTTKVQGFSCALGTYTGQATENSVDARKGVIPTAPPPSVESRYLGKLLNPRLEKRLKSWHVWNGIIPEQGLWLMYDDGKVVYLDREDILDACGLRQEGKQWDFSRSDFGSLGTESDDTGGSVSEDDDQSEGSESEEEDENAVVFVDEGQPATRARRKRRRTSTMTDSMSEGALFIADEGGLVIDTTEQFMFDNELPDVETWEKMDDEGWLKKAGGGGSSSGNPMEGSSSS